MAQIRLMSITTINAFPNPPKSVERVLMVMKVMARIQTPEIATCTGGASDDVDGVMSGAGLGNTQVGVGGEV